MKVIYFNDLRLREFRLRRPGEKELLRNEERKEGGEGDERANKIPAGFGGNEERNKLLAHHARAPLFVTRLMLNILSLLWKNNDNSAEVLS